MHVSELEILKTIKLLRAFRARDDFVMDKMMLKDWRSTLISPALPISQISESQLLLHSEWKASENTNQWVEKKMASQLSGLHIDLTTSPVWFRD